MPLLSTEDDPRVAELRVRLDDYYSKADDYTAFEAVNSKPAYWGPICERIQAIVECKDSCDVLEVGAGLSGFALGLGKSRGDVRYCAQDVTAQNEGHLRSISDEVYIGDVSKIEEHFDVIFSTFVFEHVSTPRATLQKQLDLLKPGGSLFIACPRYGFPLYVPPSARHYGVAKRTGIMCSLLLKRLSAMFTGKPAFVIHVDPALFSGPFYRDSDAIHWPSLGDLRRSLPPDCSMRQVRLDEGTGLKGLVYRSLALIFVEIRKNG